MESAKFSSNLSFLSILKLLPDHFLNEIVGFRNRSSFLCFLRWFKVGSDHGGWRELNDVIVRLICVFIATHHGGSDWSYRSSYLSANGSSSALPVGATDGAVVLFSVEGGVSGVPEGLLIITVVEYYFLGVEGGDRGFGHAFVLHDNSIDWWGW